MKFTGERYIPVEKGKIRLEHFHRYALIMQAVKGKTVLDVACGEGYGSSLLATTASSIVGVDISHEAVEHAALTYKKSNLEFRQGNVTQLDFPTASFDSVVSFETLEHLAEQEEMLLEIKRVLRPNGSLFISSPNRPVYAKESSEKNEFHVKELDFNEFDQLLKPQFKAIHYFGQKMMIGSVIQPLKNNSLALDAYHDNGTDIQIGTTHDLEDSMYFIAVCSLSDTNLPTISSSVLHPDNNELIEYYVGFAKWGQELETQLNELQNHINTITSTISWRITKPLRYIESVIFSRIPAKKSSK